MNKPILNNNLSKSDKEKINELQLKIDQIKMQKNNSIKLDKSDIQQLKKLDEALSQSVSVKGTINFEIRIDGHIYYNGEEIDIDNIVIKNNCSGITKSFANEILNDWSDVNSEDAYSSSMPFDMLRRKLKKSFALFDSFRKKLVKKYNIDDSEIESFIEKALKQR